MKILITGGALRIGKELVLHLSQQGHEVIVHYNQSETPAKILQQQIGCQLIQSDFLSAGFEEAFDFAVDVLINNAAVFAKDEALNLMQAMRINRDAPILLTERLRKLNKNLVVVNLLDSWARTKPKGFTNYYSSKIALEERLKGEDIHNIFLGAALIKKGQSHKVFEKIRHDFSFSVKELKNEIDLLLMKK